MSPRYLYLIDTTSAIPSTLPSVLLRTEHIQLLFIIAYLHFERVEKQTSTTVII